MDFKERLKMAEEFAAEHGVLVEPWMLWEGWEASVGCERCLCDGPSAPCWGYEGCHGYYWGCGCKDCTVRDEEELFISKLEQQSNNVIAEKTKKNDEIKQLNKKIERLKEAISEIMFLEPIDINIDIDGHLRIQLHKWNNNVLGDDFTIRKTNNPQFPAEISKTINGVCFLALLSEKDAINLIF